MGNTVYNIHAKASLPCVHLPVIAIAGKGGTYWPDDVPDAIRKSCVLWYDPARQGCSNERMAANPVLKDLSGNGHHATCYNFAWTEQSGINTTDYPNALVSDGVDDYCSVEGLPLLNKERGFTVLAKRKWISDINSKAQGFATKGTSPLWIDGAFYFECVEGGGLAPFNRVFSINQSGVTYISKFTENDITYLTSKEYNGSPLNNIGDAVDTDGLQLFKLAFDNTTTLSSIALYSFILFNRDLTNEEIEWVKTNLIGGENQ